MTLDELTTGEKGVITRIRGRGAFRKRITEMGFIRGKEVEVIKNAPLRDPIEYRILGYNISLRRSEASLIEVLWPGELENEDIDSLPPCGPRGERNRRFGQRYSHCPDPDEIDTRRPGKSRWTGERKRGFRGFGRVLHKRSTTINVALVGNPNSGKTTVFNHITGNRERVGNYAGVTVGVKNATIVRDGYTFNLTDLPGTYSVSEYSPEELFVRNFILEEKPDVILNVVDAGNLERNLFLTTQLIDMDVPVVTALNMYDELSARGDKLRHETLGNLLGVPMVPTIGSTGEGMDELFKRMIDVFEGQDTTYRHIHINYGPDLEQAIETVQESIKNTENFSLTDVISSRFLAVKLLESDKHVKKLVLDQCVNGDEVLDTAKKERLRLESLMSEESETLLTDARYAYIAGALKDTLKKKLLSGRSISEKIDQVVTNRYLGFPIFLFFMWLTFTLTFSLGKYPMDWIETFMGFITVHVSGLMGEGLLRELIVDGILAGVGGVIIFLPNILILFFMISLMEDSGYMARSAFIMDKLMHKIGLHGKSFIPMVMGFGCNVPAIMATRTIESRRDRLLTMMLIPFMSCSARLPVFVLIIGAFFSTWSGTMLFLIYAIGIVVAILSSLLMKNTLFKKVDMPFVMELPPYRRPGLKTSLLHMWEKGMEYLKKIGGIILIASILVWALGRFPLEVDYSVNYEREKSLVEVKYESRINTTSQTIAEKNAIINQKKEELHNLEIKQENERLEKSYIGRIGKFMAPVFEPLGFNWKMGISLVTGLAAKEIVVSTLGVLYHVDDADEEPMKLGARLRENPGMEGLTPLQAFSFIIFILLYFPCFGAIAAIKKESGSWKWAALSAFYTTSVAWIVSFIIYHAGLLIL